MNGGGFDWIALYSRTRRFVAAGEAMTVVEVDLD